MVGGATPNGNSGKQPSQASQNLPRTAPNNSGGIPPASTKQSKKERRKQNKKQKQRQRQKEAQLQQRQQNQQPAASSLPGSHQPLNHCAPKQLQPAASGPATSQQPLTTAADAVKPPITNNLPLQSTTTSAAAPPATAEKTNADSSGHVEVSVGQLSLLHKTGRLNQAMSTFKATVNLIRQPLDGQPGSICVIGEDAKQAKKELQRLISQIQMMQTTLSVNKFCVDLLQRCIVAEFSGHAVVNLKQQHKFEGEDDDGEGEYDEDDAPECLSDLLPGIVQPNAIVMKVEIYFFSSPKCGVTQLFKNIRDPKTEIIPYELFHVSALNKAKFNTEKALSIVHVRDDREFGQLVVTAFSEQHLQQGCAFIKNLLAKETRNVIPVKQHAVVFVDIPSDYFPLFRAKGPHRDALKAVTKKHALSIQWGNTDISVHGEKAVVEKARTELIRTVSTTIASFSKQTMSVPKLYITEFENDNNKLCRDCFNATSVHVQFQEATQVLLSVSFSGVQIAVKCGSLMNEAVDCIVCPTDGQLSHGDGVAGTIAKQAGPSFVAECANVVAGEGPFGVGAATITSAGDIAAPITQVIHVVGPRWQGGAANEPALLAKALRSVLELADSECIRSIAIPAISAGKFGYPAAECAHELATELFRFLEENGLNYLTRICFCEISNTVASLLEREIRQAHLEATDPFFGVNQWQSLLRNYQWKWMQDDGSFANFDEEQNKQIEQGFLNQSKRGKMQTKGKNKSTYEIDFDAMTEINTQFRRTARDIIRVPVRKTHTYQWECKVRGAATWQPYGVDGNDILENAFFAGTSLTVQGKAIEFDKMKCGTLLFNRADADYEKQWRDRESRERQRQSIPPPVSDDNVPCVLTGRTSQLHIAEQWIWDKIQELTAHETITFQRNISEPIRQCVAELQRKHKVTISFFDKAVTITGLASDVLRSKSELLDAERSDETPQYPPEWKGDTELVAVAYLSLQWAKVSNSFKGTFPSAQIHKIQRVQNKTLWRRFCFLKEELQKKGDATEKTLFHGTRLNIPSLIYSGDDGFDMRHSAAGMWGIASYFAARADYSHKYSYKDPITQLHQIFLAKVVVGKVSHLAPDNSLRKPPAGYASVQGIVNGADVFMIYDNGRAYPEFLITYSVSAS